MAIRREFTESEISSLKNLGREVCTIVAYAARRSDKSTVRWTPVTPTSASDPVDVYIGECPVNDTLTFMCGVTRVHNTSIDQIAMLLNTEKEQTPAFHGSFYGDLSHYETVTAVRRQSKQFPRHAILVKAATMPSPSRTIQARDFVYLEAQEDIMDTTRKTRGWVCAMHSIDIATRPPREDAVRGRLFRSGIVATETQEEGVIEVTYLLQVDFCGFVPLDVRLRMMGLRLHSLRFLGDHFRNLQPIRARSSSSAPSSSNESRSSMSSKSCSCCGAKFHLLQRKYTCRVCQDVFCSHCGSHQRVTPGIGVEKYSICHTCMVKSKQTTFDSTDPSTAIVVSEMSAGQIQTPPPPPRPPIANVGVRQNSGMQRSSELRTSLRTSVVTASPNVYSGDIYDGTDIGTSTTPQSGTVVNLADVGNATEILAAIAASRQPQVPILRQSPAESNGETPRPLPTDDLDDEIDGHSSSYIDTESEWRGQVGPIRSRQSLTRSTSNVVDLRDLTNASELLQALDPVASTIPPPPAFPQLQNAPANAKPSGQFTPESTTISVATLPPLASDEDAVQFRAYAPPCVGRGVAFDFDLWLHLVVAGLHEDDDEVSKPTTVPFRRGALLHVTLTAPEGFTVAAECQTQIVSWLGESTNAKFRVESTQMASVGQAVLTAKVVCGTRVAVVRSFVFVTSNRGSSFEVAQLRHEDSLLPLAHREIAFGELKLRNLLAFSQSGYSYRASFESLEVVVRMVRPNQYGDENDRIVAEFRREAAVLAMLGHHPHIVSFVGASSNVEEPLTLVSEFVSDGNLEYLVQTTRLSLAAKNRILCDAALGLLNIHEGGFVHRDVAARNCLVDPSGRAKICDFGMCRPAESPEGSYAEDGGMTPLKHMPPESLQPPHLYSYKSDVYSFGVMMWATFTEEKPFANLSGAEAAAWVLEGGRLDHVSAIPQAHRDIMAQCFQEDPAKRPSMADIVAHFRTLPSDSMP
ncbi:hypothetical protein LEN26_020531 [Aphanomyces euteiches]|nr:hypothetical protein LEN26_020531 [Aphanomyces euteiches]